MFLFHVHAELLQQLKVGPPEGFQGLEDVSDILNLTDITRSDLEPDM